VTAAHHAVISFLCFVVGSCAGSFVNVCVYRIPRALSVCRPRSRCPRCLTPIRPSDNIPVLGWLRLNGKCRSCALPISVRYPSVELAAALLFSGVYVALATRESRDPWEDHGPLGVTLCLLASWTVISLFIAGALISFDRRRDSRNRTKPPGIGGHEQAHAG
jgi:leader peptidase (prepilin peptidase)/N-methyltransferase